MNFIHLEESLSLDELIVLYEATMDRQMKLMRTMAAAAGADTGEFESVVQYVYNDQGTKTENNSGQSSRDYVPIEVSDPQKGGEVTPVFGESEIHKLPINLGYSIINSED